MGHGCGVLVASVARRCTRRCTRRCARLDGVLIGDAEILEAFECSLKAFSFRDLVGVKAATLHEGDLVAKDVPGSAQFSGEAPAPQETGRTEPPPIPVDREIDRDQIDCGKFDEKVFGSNVVRDFYPGSTAPLRERFVLFAEAFKGDNDIPVRNRVLDAKGPESVFYDCAISNNGHFKTRPRIRLRGRACRPPDGKCR